MFLTFLTRQRFYILICSFFLCLCLCFSSPHSSRQLSVAALPLLPAIPRRVSLLVFTELYFHCSVSFSCRDSCSRLNLLYPFDNMSNLFCCKYISFKLLSMCKRSPRQQLNKSYTETTRNLKET